MCPEGVTKKWILRILPIQFSTVRVSMSLQKDTEKNPIAHTQASFETAWEAWGSATPSAHYTEKHVSFPKEI